MLLHFVTRLLVSEKTPRYLYAFCQQALESYVTTSEVLYGPLETFNAFCYENNMPEFRRQVRKPHLPLQQFCKRLWERNDLNSAPIDDRVYIRSSKPHSEGPLPEHIPRNCRQFHKIEIGKVTFATNDCDNGCILKNKSICIIKNIVEAVDGNKFLIVNKFQATTPFYDIGLPSDYAGVYDCRNLSVEYQAVQLNDVEAKCYRIPKWSRVEGEDENIIENEWVFVTFLTTLVLPENQVLDN